MRQELEASKDYHNRQGSTTGKTWWPPNSRPGKRYLGRIGRTHWLTAYAPMGVAGDVLAVVEEARCTLDLTGPGPAGPGLGSERGHGRIR